MAKNTIASLGPALKQFRGVRGLRGVAVEIGVSPATLTRVEQGNIPDLETFTKICNWMSVDPGDYLGTQKHQKEKNESPFKYAVHFKKDKTINEETAKSLADLILAAQRAFESKLETV